MYARQLRDIVPDGEFFSVIMDGSTDSAVTKKTKFTVFGA